MVQLQDWGGPLLQSALFRRAVVEESAGVRKHFRSDDWAFAIHLHRNYRVRFIPERTWYYRVHQESTHIKYWSTLPMRVEVIAEMVEPELRTRALAGLLASIGMYRLNERSTLSAAKYFLASVALDPKLYVFRRLAESWILNRFHRRRRSPQNRSVRTSL